MKTKNIATLKKLGNAAINVSTCFFIPGSKFALLKGFRILKVRNVLSYLEEGPAKASISLYTIHILSNSWIAYPVMTMRKSMQFQASLK